MDNEKKGLNPHRMFPMVAKSMSSTTDSVITNEMAKSEDESLMV